MFSGNDISVSESSRHAIRQAPALAGKMEMSIPNSPAGFKRESRFLEIVRDGVRAMFAVIRR
jgi:hypothetical protein